MLPVKLLKRGSWAASDGVDRFIPTLAPSGVSSEWTIFYPSM